MAIKMDSNFVMTYNNLGALRGQMGQYEESLKMIKKAIQINPNYFEAYTNLAMTYHEMGKPKEVIPFLQDYLKRNPKDYSRIQKLLKKMNIDLE
jgi:tetratricopeptide (TPR) repeat protein